MHNFRELLVWKKAIELTTEAYKITKKFPSDERFGLISQIQRSASSIPANIAEGCGRRTEKDFAWFLNISLGSAYELETHLIVSFNLGFLQTEERDELITSVQEIQKMLYAMIVKIEKSIDKKP